MDGLARPRFSFACAKRGATRSARCLLIQIPRHALPRRALRRGDIARRRLEDVLPRAPLQRMRHAIECAAQAAGRFAPAAALPAACPARTSPPQAERVAIAALLQCLLDSETPRVFDRAKLRLGFHASLEHGGQHGEVLVVLLFGVFHGQTLPCRGALLRPRFVVRAIANGSRAEKIRSHQARNRFGPRKGRGGACLSIFRYASFADQAFKKQINEGSGTPANAGHQPPHQAMRRALYGARTLAGVPPRLSPKGIIPSQRLSFRPGFLGRGLHGRYPPSPVPVQGCTSHPGRNAGRHDAQAARERTANPPAGTALAPMTQCASAPCPSKERGC